MHCSASPGHVFDSGRAGVPEGRGVIQLAIQRSQMCARYVPDLELEIGARDNEAERVGVALGRGQVLLEQAASSAEPGGDRLLRAIMPAANGSRRLASDVSRHDHLS